MIYFVSFLTLLLSLLGCATPNYTSGQNSVPEDEIKIVELSEEGLSYLTRNRYFEATSVFYRARTYYPDLVPIRINLAISLRELGALSESEQIIKEVIAEKPNLTDAQVVYAGLLVEYEEFTEAAQWYKSAIDFELERNEQGQASQIASTAAAVFDSKRIIDLATCFAELAFALLPNNANISAAVGRVKLDRGDYASVVAFTEQVKGYSKGLIELQLIRSLALIGTGELDSALKILDRLILSVKSSPQLEPEVEIVRFAALILKLAGDEKVEPNANLLSEEDAEKFEKAFAGKANEAEIARYWPDVIRRVLNLQDRQDQIEE